jgi:hypothetical protein
MRQKPILSHYLSGTRRAHRMGETKRAFIRKPRTPARSQEEADRQTARACCAKCEWPKQLHDEVVTLANGLRLSLYGTFCAEPTADCTAEISTDVLVAPPEFGEQIVRRILAAPELQPLDVGMLICCVPGEYRAFLSYDYPDQATVFKVAEALPAEELQRQAAPRTVNDGSD